MTYFVQKYSTKLTRPQFSKRSSLFKFCREKCFSGKDNGYALSSGQNYSTEHKKWECNKRSSLSKFCRENWFGAFATDRLSLQSESGGNNAKFMSPGANVIKLSLSVIYGFS